MKQHTFTLSDSGKEFPARFGNQSITYDYPETLEELNQFLPEGVSPGTPEADAAILNAVNGQGLHLTKQKAAKDFLGQEEGEKENRRYKYATDGEVADLISQATRVAQTTRLQKPGAPRGEGAATKVAKAESRAANAEKQVENQKSAVRAAYLGLPKNARAGFAATLIEQGVFTQDEINELNQQ